MGAEGLNEAPASKREEWEEWEEWKEGKEGEEGEEATAKACCSNKGSHKMHLLSS